jgi:hypothetical protein
MPDAADLQNIKAKFENGTLLLEIPKVKVLAPTPISCGDTIAKVMERLWARAVFS